MDVINLDDRLNALQQISQAKLVQILDSITGKKDLIIEQKLMKILDSYIGVTELKTHGVDKIFKFTQGLKPMNVQRIFVISCGLKLCQEVFDQIRSENSQSPGLSHTVLLVPYVPMSVTNLLEENGLAGIVSLKPLCWEFIKRDGNVLSLEIPIFASLYYYKDTSHLQAFARNLWTLRMVLGIPNFTLTVGNHSKAIEKMIITMDKAFGLPSQPQETGAMIIMDRNQDLISPLLTPVTYLGLLSEVADIKMGVAALDKSQAKLDPCVDKVYEEVRDKHFSDAFPIIRAKAKALKTEQEAMKSMKLNEMKKYVQTELQKTTKTKQQLEFHISAFEAAVNELASKFEELNYVQSSILECTKRAECLEYILRNIDDHPNRSLRLFSLLSITSDGVTTQEIQPIQKSHLHAHGYEHIPLFYKLETSGLVTKSESFISKDNVLKKLPNWTSKWMTNSKRLKLFPPTQSSTNPKESQCPSYVFSRSYIPLIAQILKVVNCQISDTKSFDELINVTGCSYSGIRGPVHPGVIIVCVVGGISYGEISACRLVEKIEGIQMILVSDSIINGNNLIENLQNA